MQSRDERERREEDPLNRDERARSNFVRDLVQRANPRDSPTAAGCAVPVSHRPSLTSSSKQLHSQRLVISNEAISGHLTTGCDISALIRKPDGGQLSGSNTCMETGLGGFMDVKTLPATGTSPWRSTRTPRPPAA
jgi:hypothetical protein